LKELLLQARWSSEAQDDCRTVRINAKAESREFLEERPSNLKLTVGAWCRRKAARGF